MDKISKLKSKLLNYIKYNVNETDDFINAVLSGIEKSYPELITEDFKTECLELDKQKKHSCKSVDTVLNYSAQFDWLDYKE